ncbi:MAG: hypothetical protein QNK61_12115, partial [Akkermansiaceae bacterium]
MNYQFTFFRIVLGSYLLWHFLGLLPYGTEIFSDQGIISDGSLNFTPQVSFLSSPAPFSLSSSDRSPRPS